MAAQLDAFEAMAEGERPIVIFDATSPVRALLAFILMGGRAKQGKLVASWLESLAQLTRKCEVIGFVWQSSHMGEAMNELADVLADEAAKGGVVTEVPRMEVSYASMVFPKHRGSAFAWAFKWAKEVAIRRLGAASARTVRFDERRHFGVTLLGEEAERVRTQVAAERYQVADRGHHHGVWFAAQVKELRCAGCGAANPDWMHAAFRCTCKTMVWWRRKYSGAVDKAFMAINACKGDAVLPQVRMMRDELEKGMQRGSVQPMSRAAQSNEGRRELREAAAGLWRRAQQRSIDGSRKVKRALEQATEVGLKLQMAYKDMQKEQVEEAGKEAKRLTCLGRYMGGWQGVTNGGPWKRWQLYELTQGAREATHTLCTEVRARTTVYRWPGVLARMRTRLTFARQEIRDAIEEEEATREGGAAIEEWLMFWMWRRWRQRRWQATSWRWETGDDEEGQQSEVITMMVACLGVNEPGRMRAGEDRVTLGGSDVWTGRLKGTNGVMAAAALRRFCRMGGVAELRRLEGERKRQERRRRVQEREATRVRQQEAMTTYLTVGTCSGAAQERIVERVVLDLVGRRKNCRSKGIRAKRRRMATARVRGERAEMEAAWTRRQRWLGDEGDDKGRYAMEEVLAVRRPARRKGRQLQIQVRWVEGTITWEPLKKGWCTRDIYEQARAMERMAYPSKAPVTRPPKRRTIEGPQQLVGHRRSSRLAGEVVMKRRSTVVWEDEEREQMMRAADAKRPNRRIVMSDSSDDEGEARTGTWRRAHDGRPRRGRRRLDDSSSSEEEGGDTMT